MKARDMHYLGWILFVVSAFFFIANSSNSIEMAASLFFLAGCLVFLLSMYVHGS